MCIRQRSQNLSRTTVLGLKPTGRARQQGDPNVPNQPGQGSQDDVYFTNDLMQYIVDQFYDDNLNQMQRYAKSICVSNPSGLENLRSSM